MTSFYNLLKYAQTGIASPDMTYFDKMRASTLMGGTAQTLTGQPPLSFKADGSPLISWSMKGNGSQSGTPTPDNPVMPTFCGVRTENLFDIPDKTTTMRGVKVEKHGETIYLSGTASTSGGRLDNISGTFTLKAGVYRFTGNSPVVCFLQSATNTTKYYNLNSTNPITIDEDSSWFFSINVVAGTNYDGKSISNIMLNSGSTALPYEPFGWAEKITCAGQTTPVYLGQVSTVRRIKKLVLTGEERWSNVGGNAPYRIALTDIVLTTDRNRVLFLSSHYLAVSNSASWPQYSTCVSWAFAGNVNAKCLQFRDTNQETLADFKSYLAQQYAAGTPATVWYVLAEPETGIVNEPLAKIGDYADELHSEDAGVSIPTAKGQNTLTVDTELQPSEMTITGRIQENV